MSSKISGTGDPEEYENKIDTFRGTIMTNGQHNILYWLQITT